MNLVTPQSYQKTYLLDPHGSVRSGIQCSGLSFQEPQQAIQATIWVGGCFAGLQSIYLEGRTACADARIEYICLLGSQAPQDGLLGLLRT